MEGNTANYISDKGRISKYITNSHDNKNLVKKWAKEIYQWPTRTQKRCSALFVIGEIQK